MESNGVGGYVGDSSGNGSDNNSVVHRYGEPEEERKIEKEREARQRKREKRATTDG